MEQETTSLFEIRLSEKGVHYILRFAKLARWVLALVIIECIFDIGMETLYRFTLWQPAEGLSKLAAVLDRYYVYYLPVYVVLAILQTSYYLSFSRRLSAGIRGRDEVVFNSAFKALYLNAVTGIVLVVFATILSGLRFYTYIELYLDRK